MDVRYFVGYVVLLIDHLDGGRVVLLDQMHAEVDVFVFVGDH